MRLLTFKIDGTEISARDGQTIMQAADEAGIYIPRLCSHRELVPYGACRVCTVVVNGRPQTACTQPVINGMTVENDTERLLRIRRSIIDMLFVEGNHYCMFCEKSGCCELQAMAYRLGIPVPAYPYQYPARSMDATHPGVFVDRNRCILCARCIRASRDVDKKNAFGFVGRGPRKEIGVNAAGGLGDTDVSADDKAVAVCPVGTLMRKHVGYAVPVGWREFDDAPIGTATEQRRRIPPMHGDR